MGYLYFLRLNETSLCSATYVRWQRGTARIRPAHAAAAVSRAATAAQTAAAAGTDRRKDGRTDGHRSDSQTLNMRAVSINV